MRRFASFFGSILLVLAVARAQNAPADTPAEGEESAESTLTTPESATGLVSQVKIDVRQFGVGDVVRAGDYFGLQLALTDSADKPRKAAVVMHLTDDDGDTALITRLVTLNPRVPIDVWLYARMPWSADKQMPPIEISIHEAPAESDDAGAAAKGRQIAATRLRPISVIESNIALFGIIGQSGYGLEQYELRDGKGGSLPIAHEATRVIHGLTPASLPDDWRGLAAYETIVWTDGDPLRLEGARPAALRDWVNRGGHLVIFLPTVGSTWWADVNPIADLLPAVEVKRLEDVSLAPYRGLLTTPDYDKNAFPKKTTLHTFAPNSDALPVDATPLFEGPDGIIGVRRIVGTGMVTLMGLDLTDRTLNQSQIMRADALWHRILGRRFTFPTDKDKDIQFAFGGPSRQFPDDHIAGEISKSAAAGVGVLLGLVVFWIYWLVSGPISWGVLRARNASRHAWVVFALTTAVFTGIAWAGATWIKPKEVKAYHLTFLDHVYGQPVQRVRTWAGVYLPGYGDTTIRVGERDAGGSSHQALTTWSSPANDSSGQSFPDARGYGVDVRRPDSITFPTRATIKELQVDYAGGQRWKMLRPVDKDHEPRLVRRGQGWDLTGELVNDLPAPLRDVTVILVTRQISEDESRDHREKNEHGFMLSEAYAWNLVGDWNPGTTQDLSGKNFTREASTRADGLLDRLVPTTSLTSNVLESGLDRSQAPTAYKRLALLNMLKPPEYTKEAGTFMKTDAILNRRAAQTLDLSKWFTQPSLIVIGFVDDTAAPTPLLISDGDTDRPIAGEGRTVVRWIFPLEGEPVTFTGRIPPPTAAPPAKKPTKNDDTEPPATGKPTGGR